MDRKVRPLPTEGMCDARRPEALVLVRAWDFSTLSFICLLNKLIGESLSSPFSSCCLDSCGQSLPEAEDFFWTLKAAACCSPGPGCSSVPVSGCSLSAFLSSGPGVQVSFSVGSLSSACDCSSPCLVKNHHHLSHLGLLSRRCPFLIRQVPGNWLLCLLSVLSSPPTLLISMPSDLLFNLLLKFLWSTHL